MKQKKDSVDVEQLRGLPYLDIIEAEPAHATPTEVERIINTVKAELVARMLPLYIAIAMYILFCYSHSLYLITVNTVHLKTYSYRLHQLASCHRLFNLQVYTVIYRFI